MLAVSDTPKPPHNLYRRDAWYMNPAENQRDDGQTSKQ